MTGRGLVRWIVKSRSMWRWCDVAFYLYPPSNLYAERLTTTDDCSTVVQSLLQSVASTSISGAPAAPE